MFHPNISHMEIFHCVKKNQSWFHSAIIMKLEGVSSERADTRARLEVSSYEMDHYDRHGDDNDEEGNDGDVGCRNIESIRLFVNRDAEVLNANN